MRVELAEKLLVAIMNWSDDEIRKERPLLQAMSNLKYDEYQQFPLGTRFVESLVVWLQQFDDEDKKIAYEFIKNQLVFISNSQMIHLVNCTYSEKVVPKLITRVAVDIGAESYEVRKIVNSDNYREIRRRSLFIGLSDGARIDQLRRSAHLSNEQVIPTYSINQAKIGDLIDELSKDGFGGYFSSIFLFDDFTASGTSFLRFDEGEWKGKIVKVVKSLKDSKSPDALAKLISPTENIAIHVLFYIATEVALDRLIKRLDEWLESSGIDGVEISFEAMQTISPDTKQKVLDDKPFVTLAKKYFDSDISDKHYEKGKHDYPHLGFDECGLPLILLHNTPNNSLPILWSPEGGNFVGLFPRITRHKE